MSIREQIIAAATVKQERDQLIAALAACKVKDERRANVAQEKAFGEAKDE